mmetsp:Transcript_38827/g.120012  ORF Transcript_38827/g.120012 Transcript_38827/m.120012 type:complete len:120 (-) Transcript_38827:887-1246(-)
MVFCARVRPTPTACCGCCDGQHVSSETRRASRMAAAHWSASVVARTDTGYELPEPPLAEHLGRMERRAAIAITVHGLTADVDQFAPDRVPAEVLAASTARCVAWLTEARRTETMVDDDA